MDQSVPLREAAPGDVIVILGHRVGEIVREGEVLEVLGEPGHEHFRVRWDDERETLFYPSGNDTMIKRGKRRRSRSLAGKS